MKTLPLLTLLINIFFISSISLNLYATEKGFDKDKLIATHMYNFLKYTDYKSTHLKDADRILICINGNQSLYNHFKAIKWQPHQDKAIEIIRVNNPEKIKNCHQLFIGDPKKQEDFINKSLVFGILTFSDKISFTKEGGIVEFYVKHENIRFKINLTAMKLTNLQLNSRLLELADIE